MPSSTRKIGIIGVGFGAQVHVPGFRSEGWEVAAICSRNREKAQKAGAEAGIDAVYTDPMELIRRDDLGTAMVAHEFRHTPQRAYIRQLLDEGYIGKFQLCTIELFLDRYVTAQPRPLTWMAHKADGGGLLGALGSHYIDGLRFWFGEVASVSGRLATLRPDLVDTATGKKVEAETDDSFLLTLTFKNGGMATMIASFAVTPTRGAKIVVMGDNGTLIAEQPGPNPMENGVVVASRNGAPLQELKTPAQYTPFTDARDHRLMAFRLLVRDFTTGVEQGTSPAPNFTDGLRCQQVLDAVHESSESGRTVYL